MDQLVRLGVHLLEVLFFTGIVGSLGVVIVSVLGDIRELPSPDLPSPTRSGKDEPA